MIYLIVANLYSAQTNGIYTGMVEAPNQVSADNAAAKELTRISSDRFRIRHSVILAPRNADQSFGDEKPVVRHGAMMFMDNHDQ